jgi:hypothetical protein
MASAYNQQLYLWCSFWPPQYNLSVCPRYKFYRTYNQGGGAGMGASWALDQATLGAFIGGGCITKQLQDSKTVTENQWRL